MLLATAIHSPTVSSTTISIAINASAVQAMTETESTAWRLKRIASKKKTFVMSTPIAFTMRHFAEKLACVKMDTKEPEEAVTCCPSASHQPIVDIIQFATKVFATVTKDMNEIIPTCELNLRNQSMTFKHVSFPPSGAFQLVHATVLIVQKTLNVVMMRG